MYEYIPLHIHRSFTKEYLRTTWVVRDMRRYERGTLTQHVPGMVMTIRHMAVSRKRYRVMSSQDIHRNSSKWPTKRSRQEQVTRTHA